MRSKRPPHRVLGFVDAGFIAWWNGQQVLSISGEVHHFPSEWDAWMFLYVCDVVEGMPPIRPDSPQSVISKRDTHCAANLLIRQHGQDAEIEAARKAGLMLDRDDRDGYLAWLNIKRAIVELQAPQGGRAH
jgi:hypothetical protein